MDINCTFYEGAIKTLNQISKWNIKPINYFPLTDFITQGDLFFKKIWQMIDNSRSYCWITTYAMDSSPCADTTLHKLIIAAKRGVNVVLMVDDVQCWATNQLVKKLQLEGGKFYSLNPMFTFSSLKKYITKDVWRRHHEKLIVSDEKAMIGSSNLEGNYAGIKYGNSTFRDINFYCENIILTQFRQHFKNTADLYELQLHSQKSNSQISAQWNSQYPNSQFYENHKYRLLHNDPLNKKREIEQSVISMVQKANSSIILIQPYYYPIVRFDRAIYHARQRQISTSIITSGRRDQPAFKSMLNFLLFEQLMRFGVKVSETKQRILHSKVYWFDNKWINLGSMNNDRWSWRINNEINILIENQRDGDFIRAYHNKLIQNSLPVRRENQRLSLDRVSSIQFWQMFLYLSEIVMSKLDIQEKTPNFQNSI